MRKITFNLIIMATLCASAMVMGVRDGVGRVASAHQVNRGFLIGMKSTKKLQRGHQTHARVGDSIAFATFSRFGHGIGNDGNRHHRRLRLQSPQIGLRQQLSSSARVDRSLDDTNNDADIGEFFANPKMYPNFSSLTASSTLLNRLSSPSLGLQRPSAVQAAVFDAISRGDNDVIVGAETGEHNVD